MSNRIQVNVGAADRLLRALIGAGLLFAGLTGDRLTLSVIGVVVLLTAAVRFCPLYALIGVSTCPRKMT